MWMMKGQVTAEYLLLFAVGLALIAISVGALAVIKDAESSLTDLEKAKIAAASLKSAGDGVCALGSGNSRVVELAWDVSLECGGDALRASVGEGSATASIEHCDVSCYGAEGKRFTVSNYYGEVEIEETD
jgi:hypothetical protein